MQESDSLLTQAPTPQIHHKNLDKLEEALALERKAHQLRGEKKIGEAFEAFDRAAVLYRNAGEHLKAALCFASAASAWNLHTGWQPLSQAALRTYWAAQEAMKAKNYDYARTLYRDAALLFEKEGDSENYSACFLESHRADRKRAWEIFAGDKEKTALMTSESIGWSQRMNSLIRWLINSLSDLVWGYGERPLRTGIAACVVISICALFYFASSFAGLILAEGVRRPVYFDEALYLSVITYSTVGYGDYLPLGAIRILASLEALIGIFLTPLFLIALSRRYLRMYR